MGSFEKEWAMAAEHRIVKAGVIKVGNRVRKDMGDMTALTESIRTIGLLHPPIVDAEYNLIAGRRRLAAYVNELGNIDVPVLVVRELSDAAMALQAERDENTCRKDMTPTELVEIGRRIEELERPKAKERQGRRTDLQLPENFTGSEKGRSYTRDIVGEAIGMSGPTYQRAKAVVEAAEREPAKFADVAEQMAENALRQRNPAIRATVEV